jgi:hypothetical protein
MENLILILVFITGLCGFLGIASLIEHAIRTRRERKFHERVMSKVLF